MTQAATLAIEGNVDGSSVELFDAALNASVGGGAKKLILDFTAAEYINSSGIGAIVLLLTKAREHGLALEAFGLSEHYRHIFEITRLDDFIDIRAVGARQEDE